MKRRPKAYLAKCDECPLYPYDYALGQGPEQSDIVFVGEAPGATEVQTGEPFTGPSGELISKTVELHGEDFYSYHITNACLCRPPDNADPPQKAIDACRDRLIFEISARKPKLVVLMGNHAIKAVLGQNTAGVMKMRGDPIWDEANNWWIFPILHPAAVLYLPTLFNQFERDIGKLIRMSKRRGSNHFGPRPTKYEVARDANHVLQHCWNLAWKSKVYEVSWDLETEGLDPLRGWILCMQISHRMGHSFIIPDHVLYRDIDARIPNPLVVNALKHVLQNPLISVIGQNLKFDVNWTEKHLGFVVKIGFDTILAHHMINNTPGFQNIESIAESLLDCPPWEKHLIEGLPTKKSNLSKAKREVLYEYAARDTDITLQCMYKLKPKVEGTFLYKNVLLPAAKRLQRAESRGIKLDVGVCQSVTKILQGEIEGITRDLWEEANHEFNPNSPKQVSAIMFDEMDLFVPRNVNQGKLRSTNRTVLDWLVDNRGNEFARLLIEWRTRSKLVSTYIDKMPKIANDEVIRASFNLTGTITGRLSSSDPNLQNIPKESRIRDMFVARDGYKFLEADFSQAELRWLAEMSDDPDLLQIFEDDRNDPHGETARAIYGDDYTPLDRAKAKNVNFGVVYGIGAQSLSTKYKMEKIDAIHLIEGWHQRFPKASKWITNQQEKALNGETIESPFGRTWTFGLITDKTEHIIEKESVNYPIQSAASDLCTYNGIVKTSDALDHLDAHLLIPVHDSCLYEVREDHLEEAIDIVRKTMVECSALGVKVRFKVDVNTGNSWGSLEEV